MTSPAFSLPDDSFGPVLASAELEWRSVNAFRRVGGIYVCVSCWQSAQRHAPHATRQEIECWALGATITILICRRNFHYIQVLNTNLLEIKVHSTAQRTKFDQRTVGEFSNFALEGMPPIG